MHWLVFLLLPALAWADDELTICYNWGCSVQEKVVFSYPDLDSLSEIFNNVESAEVERGSIRLAVAFMERVTARQTPTGNDRGGNINDDGLDGRMDCIDHSHNSTAYLRLLERRGLLKFHRVLDPVDRAPLLFDAHWAALIEEKDNAQRFIVDSWFFDNGEPPAIFTLEDWKRGAEPPHG